MGLGFVLVLYLILSVPLLGIGAIVAKIAKRLLRIESGKALLAVRLFPFGLAVLPIALLIGALIWSNFAPPSFMFRDVFGHWPGDDIRELKSAADSSNDGQHVYLAFKTTQPPRTLLPHLQPFAGSEAFGTVPLLTGSPPPQWWAAERCKDRSILVGRNIRQWEEIVVTQCRSDDRVYVEAIWVD